MERIGKPIWDDQIPLRVALEWARSATSPSFRSRFVGEELSERARWPWSRPQWRIREPILSLSDFPRPRTLAVTPAHAVSDGTSGPMTPVINQAINIRGRRAAGDHDVIGYRWDLMSRADSDSRFGQLLIAEEDVGPVRRRLMYAAVRVGGWYAYKPWRGCLDRHQCRGPGGGKCMMCPNYYPYKIGTGDNYSHLDFDRPAAGIYFMEPRK